MIKPHSLKTYIAIILTALVYTIYKITMHPDVEKFTHIVLAVVIVLTFCSMVGLLFYLNQLDPLDLTIVINWFIIIGLNFLFVYVVGHLDINQPVWLTILNYVGIVWLCLVGDWYIDFFKS